MKQTAWDMLGKMVVVASCALLLQGCASWREGWQESWQNWRQPTDPAVQRSMDQLYAGGAVALGRNDVDGAIVSWREFARIAPVHLARTKKVRGYLTLLDREAAKRFARRVAAREKTAPFATTDRMHVALFPLTNQGPVPSIANSAPFNRAVMAMISADLSHVPGLTLLEREKVHHLVQELKLADSPLVDRATINRHAQLLGAGTVVAGSVYNEAGPAGPGSGRYRINTAVSDVAAGRVVGVQQAEGKQAEFFDLQKQVVHGILQAMDIRDIPPAVNRIHTRSWAAYAQFAGGLKLLEEDRFDEARQAFRNALALDPGFVLAEQAILDTPEKAATLEQIRAELQAPS